VDNQETAGGVGRIPVRFRRNRRLDGLSLMRIQLTATTYSCGNTCGLPGTCGKLGEMKAFYSQGAISEEAHGQPSSVAVEPYIYVRARVAVYDAAAAAPRVVDVDPAPITDYIEKLTSTVYTLAREQGGTLPYSVVREVSENFIHADFAEPVVSILDAGHTIRFADQGPGIRDKERALLPGFTTAVSAMKPYIRGVGSGLPLVRDFLTVSGGTISVDDNLGAGAVITVTSGVLSGAVSGRPAASAATAAPSLSMATAGVSSPETDGVDESASPHPLLTTRQKHVLALVMESGSVGPSLVSKELKIGISTAYRDLASLEELGLIEADGGKRALTPSGLTYLDKLITGLH